MSCPLFKYPIRLLFHKEQEFCYSLYKVMGFYPHNTKYYHTALATPAAHAACKESESIQKGLNNERMEFLGDAIIGNAVAIYLYNRFPKKDEGFLTDMRSRFVKRKSLDYLCKKVGLSELISKNALKHQYHNSYVNGNVVEAFIAAIFLDRGIKKCRKFIIGRLIEPNFDTMINFDPDYKTLFMQYMQKMHISAEFKTEQSGTEHEPEFETTIVYQDRTLGVGHGYTKKESHQKACKAALEYVKENNLE